jgi:glycosyltransferase involved in cell wall biosynthesis
LGIKSKKLKVFHGLVNYGTQAGLLARGLRNMNIDAISVAQFDSFERPIDIILRHGGNIFQKLYNHILNNAFLFKCFFRYNIFHFYSGTTLTGRHWDLPFYRLFGKKIICHYLGKDVQLYRDLVDKYTTTNISRVINFEKSEDRDRAIRSRLARETRYAYLQLVCAPYLYEFVPGSQILPLAIDLREFEYCPRNVFKDEIVIMHAPTDRASKGTSIILGALDRLIKEGFNIKILLVENVTHKELKEKYKECDIFIDQILSGWYGTAAIEAMATGRPVVCFLREEYYQYIDYGDEIPIINADPESIYVELKNVLQKKEKLIDIGFRSRLFVEKIHDIDLIINKLISIYNDIN